MVIRLNRHLSQRLWLLTQRSVPFWFLAPSLLILLVFQAYPSLFSFYLAMHRQQGAQIHFVGLRNFTLLFEHPEFWESLWHTVLFLGAFLIIIIPLALLIALCLTAHGRFSSLTMLLIFIPWVLSEVVAGTIWRWMFLRDYGILQVWLYPLTGQTLLATPSGAMAILVAASIWRWLALTTLLLVAAIQLIPNELAENAALDGASEWERFWAITIPLIRPQLLLVLLLLSLRIINSSGLILTITGGGPARATTTLSFYLYQTAWQFGNLGVGAALAIIMFGINMLLTLLSLRLLRAE